MKGQGWADRRTELSTVEAEALLASDRPSNADLWCGTSKHRLGRLYDLPDRGLTLALRESVLVASDLYENPAQPDEVVTLLAGLYALSSDLRTVRRCRCGTWAINMAVIRSEYEAGSRHLQTSYTFLRAQRVGRSERF